MLANNFKTHTELLISETDFAGLVGVLGMLERGELTHVNEPAILEAEGPARLREPHFPFKAFNMGDWGGECGTVACIAGWSDRLFGTDFTHGKRLDGDDCSLDLLELFVGDGDGPELSEITTGQAAIAVRNFLTYGEARWGEVCGQAQG